MNPSKLCECKLRVKLVRDPHCPLKTGPSGDFFILGLDDSKQYPVSHCIACGGLLAEGLGKNDHSSGGSSSSLACNCVISNAGDPICPVKKDEKVGEYQLVRKTSSGRSAFVLRHCPWCGQMLDSLRATLFVHVLPEEADRLRGLLKGVRTIGEAISRLGPPDREWQCPDDPVRREIYGMRRTLRQLDYRGLSSTGDLLVVEYEGGTVGVSITPKAKNPAPR
jgi:hypothetical protein